MGGPHFVSCVVSKCHGTSCSQPSSTKFSCPCKTSAHGPDCLEVPSHSSLFPCTYLDSSSQKQKTTIDSWFKQHEAGRTIMYQSPNCLRKGLYIIVCTPGFFARRHTYHWFRPPGHHITQHHVTTRHQFQQFPASHPCALDTYWILQVVVKHMSNGMAVIVVAKYELSTTYQKMYIIRIFIN